MYDKISTLARISIEENKEYFSELHEGNSCDKTSSYRLFNLHQCYACSTILFNKNSSETISVLENTNDNSRISRNKNSHDHHLTEILDSSCVSHNQSQDNDLSNILDDHHLTETKSQVSSNMAFTDALPILFARKRKILDHNTWTNTNYHQSSTVEHNHTSQLLSLFRVLSDDNANYALSLLSNARNRLKSQTNTNDSEQNLIDLLIVNNIN